MRRVRCSAKCEGIMKRGEEEREKERKVRKKTGRNIARNSRYIYIYNGWLDRVLPPISILLNDDRRPTRALAWHAPIYTLGFVFTLTILLYVSTHTCYPRYISRRYIRSHEYRQHSVSKGRKRETTRDRERERESRRRDGWTNERPGETVGEKGRRGYL